MMLDDNPIIGGGCLIKDLLHSGSGLMKGGSNDSFSNNDSLNKFLNLGIPHGLVVDNNFTSFGKSSDKVIVDRVIDDKLFDGLFDSIRKKSSKILTKSNRTPKYRFSKKNISI